MQSSCALSLPLELQNFNVILQDYMRLLKYHEKDSQENLLLTPEAIEQLSWSWGNPKKSPQDWGYDELNEIKRSLPRLYAFELLLRAGDEIYFQQAYKEFIRGQSEGNSLSEKDFAALSEQARLLDEDIQAVIKVSCFLVISPKAKKAMEAVLKKTNGVMAEDSEDFLTQFAEVTQSNEVFPLTKNLTPAQIALLQKVYWQTMHFRHMLYTEGSNNMTKTFSDGIKSGKFIRKDFQIWKWRWLTNSFGFSAGPGATYYDKNTHQLVMLVLNHLEKLFENVDYVYLDHYLLERASLAGLTHADLHLTIDEQQFLAHLAAYCNRINVITPELGHMIYEGYAAFKIESHDVEEVAKQYTLFRYNKEAVTPTYVPAIMNNAFIVFRGILFDEKQALKQASQFMCQVLKTLYALPLDKRISCFDISQEAVLKPILQEWHNDHHAFNFGVDESGSLIATRANVESRNLLRA